MSDHEPQIRRSVLDVTESERTVLFKALEQFVKKSQRADKARSFKITAILLLIAGYVLFNVGALIYDPSVPHGGDYAAVVRMDGEISASKLLNASNYAEPLAKAFHDDNAKGVALVINSPGGSPAQSQLIHDMINRLEAETGKRAIVVSEDYLASGAYMIAVSADKIYAPTTGFVGSIGVVMPGYDLSEFAERYGIRDRTFTAGESKAPFNMLKSPTERDIEKVHEYLTDLHEEFIRLVKEGRGERIENAGVNLFTGEVWTGLRAERLGLTDGHLSLQDAIEAEFGVDQTRIYSPKLGFGQLLQALM
jgi:protease-4